MPSHISPAPSFEAEARYLVITPTSFEAEARYLVITPTSFEAEAERRGFNSHS